MLSTGLLFVYTKTIKRLPYETTCRKVSYEPNPAICANGTYVTNRAN